MTSQVAEDTMLANTAVKKRNYSELKRKVDKSCSKTTVNLELACFLLVLQVLHFYCNNKTLFAITVINKKKQ